MHHEDIRRSFYALADVPDLPYPQYRTNGRDMSVDQIFNMKLGYMWAEHGDGSLTLPRHVRLEWLSEMTGREILTTGNISKVEGATAANTLSIFELKALIVMLESFQDAIITWLKELKNTMKSATVTEVTFEQPYIEGSINPQRLAEAIEEALDPKKIIFAQGKLIIHLPVANDLKKAQDDIEKKINGCMRNELRIQRGSQLAKKEETNV